MRLLIGTDTYPPDVNGAAYFTRQLAAGLASRGHDVHVLCPSTTRRSATASEAHGVITHRVPAVRTPFHPSFRISPPPTGWIAARRTLAGVGPDVIHIQNHFLLGRALLQAAARQGVPVVATNHFMPENLLGYAPWLPPSGRRWLTSWAWRDFARTFNSATLITTPTRTACRLISEVGLRKPVSAVSCGVALDRFAACPSGTRAARWRALPDRPTILFVGRLDEEKRVEDLIDALALVRYAIDAQLVIVGAGVRHEALAARARGRGIGDSVHFTGFVPDEELPSAYASCDVFANAGVAELQSLVTMEAMASGKPVVAAAAMALPELVSHGENGFLFTPGDVPSAARFLQRLLADPSLACRMGTASRRRIADHSIDATLDRFETLYGQALLAARPVTGIVRRSPRPAGRPVHAETTVGTAKPGCTSPQPSRRTG